MNGAASLLQSREGVTQGDPLTMVAYGIGVIPLIQRLKLVYTNFTQTWYNDYAPLGTYKKINLYFNSPKKIGPGRGYCPEP